ncbi:hypothetical protein L1887_60011 [Cichorium endivia]|nr:hypothetical protein L1887_60011 [Cichorium endivia]
MFRTAAPPAVPSSFGNVSGASAHASSSGSGSVARHHTDKALASEDLRRRFVKAESLLFRLRFETDDASERESFMRSLNLDWNPVSNEEKNQYREQLVATHPKMASTFDSETFFKVDWTRVTDLVEKRRVFMRAGQAWVPIKEQSSLVLAEFQSRLMRDLEMTARALPRLDEDDRLLPVLSHLSMGFLAGISTDYTGSSITADGTTTVTAGMVDALVKTHAPLCMKNLHSTLTATGHLKHYGRLQASRRVRVSIAEAKPSPTPTDTLKAAGNSHRPKAAPMPRKRPYAARPNTSRARHQSPCPHRQPLPMHPSSLPQPQTAWTSRDPVPSVPCTFVRSNTYSCIHGSANSRSLTPGLGLSETKQKGQDPKRKKKERFEAIPDAQLSSNSNEEVDAPYPPWTPSDTCS